MGESKRQIRSLFVLFLSHTCHSPSLSSLYHTLPHTLPHTTPHSRWYGSALRVPRTFRSRHALLTLHVWLLHKRLVLDTYDPSTALHVDAELFHILWDDTTCRIRAQPNVMELAVNKHLLQVQQYTFLHLTHYDHAYDDDDDMDNTMLQEGPEAQQQQRRHQELRNLVWHHVFVRDPALEHAVDVLDPFVHYIDMNVQNIICTWPDAYYREARVVWTDLPIVPETTDTTTTTVDTVVHPDDVLPHPWCRNITRRGQVYYWNTETYESTFERPTTAASSSSSTNTNTPITPQQDPAVAATTTTTTT